MVVIRASGMRRNTHNSQKGDLLVIKAANKSRSGGENTFKKESKQWEKETDCERKNIFQQRKSDVIST